MFLCPLCAVSSRSLRPMALSLTSLDLEGREKLMTECNKGLFEWWIKKPRTTSKQIQAALQTQGTTVSARTIRRHLNEMGRYGRRPRRTPLLTQRHKKARLEFAKNLPGEAKIILGERPVAR